MFSEEHLPTKYRDPEFKDYESVSAIQLRRLARFRGLIDSPAIWDMPKMEVLRLFNGKPGVIKVADPEPVDPGVNDAGFSYLVRSAVTVELARRVKSGETIGVVERGTTINVHVKNRPTVKIEGETVHKRFKDVLQLASAGIPILLVGPAGSGKTRLAEQVAKALGRAFTFNSMSAGVSESSILGRMLPNGDGNWTYRPAPFIKTCQNGGVHLFDEMDAADANLMVLINAPMANGHVSIPFSEMPPIKLHPDTVLIAAANTFGHGANRQYVGRNQLDAATLDRFTMGTIEVDYDQKLETKILEGKSLTDEERASLLNWAWGTREKIGKNRLRRIMSTRTIEKAADRIAHGGSQKDITETYFLGWTKDEKAKVAL